MKIPILSYHALDIGGTGYADNDLVAFASDLETIHAMGFEVMALSRVVELWLDSPEALESSRVIALTCDDGSDFDYHDLPHPVAGTQRSMFNALRDFRGRHPGAQPHLSLTSFVIVSPEARRTLDRTCLLGRGWWNDDWWRPAIASGLMEIGSHSWDHNHDTLPADGFPARRGTFETIDNDSLADLEIAGAQAHLAREAPNAADSLFAYPYGETNAFLVEDYFPRRAEAIGVRAAFTERAGWLDEQANRWKLPRFMFRRDWRSPEALEELLSQAA
jgi:hypothetical protein